MATTQVQITGIAKPVERRRDGHRVYVYVDNCSTNCIHMTAPTRSKLRSRMIERGATEDMLREAGL